MPINKEKKTARSIVLPKEVEQEVYDLAYKNRRSFSSQAAVLVEFALKKLKEEEKSN